MEVRETSSVSVLLGWVPSLLEAQRLENMLVNGRSEGSGEKEPLLLLGMWRK
jgi:hypothetical protein